MSSPVTVERAIRSIGCIRILNINVFLDEACTKAAKAVDWGTLTPGGTSTIILYVKNTGTVGVALALRADACTPAEMVPFMTLTWDYDGSALPRGESRGVSLTLAVRPDITGVKDFSFNIIISVEEVKG